MIQVKIFDEDHEKDLEEAINIFLQEQNPSQVIDIKYQMALSDSFHDEEETIYSYSAMIIYKK